MQMKKFRKRNAILSYLQSTTAHPSADMVYEQLHRQMPDISLATVYRNLALFQKQGQIIRVGTVAGAERYDGNTTPHTHFICTGCNTVLDLPQVVLPAPLQHEAASASGGEITGCCLTFTGLCRDCRQHTCKISEQSAP